ncbi:hypothetical protein PAI11_22180 [Patulibacter medicamentivorans]|uniref:Uncharacterized protein n=1 Tax=Patulibacter medicamentivorans TaxID=1097667 RepID=H0E5Y8_9ACTN|nr:hypothetical protein PAI11_22180 [Patulibacter medicamentivorans]
MYQHRLLSTAQVHELHTPDTSLRWCQRLLFDTEQAGLTESVRRPGGEKLHFLTARGADAVETIPSRGELRRKLVRREQAAGPLQQHTLAVNDVGLAFVRNARRHDDDCPPLAWRHEIAHPIGGGAQRGKGELLIADAVLTYTTVTAGRVTVDYRFIELDRGTMATDALAQKLVRYSRLLDYRGAKAAPGEQPLWRRHFPVFPHVLVVLAHRPRGQLRRRGHRALALARSFEGDRLAGLVSCCLLEDLLADGPEAPIFTPIEDPGSQRAWVRPRDDEEPES